MIASATENLRAKLAEVANPEEYLDGLGLSSTQCISKDYGKDRGIHPIRSEAQRKAVEKLAAHIKRGGGVLSHHVSKSSTQNSGEDHSDEEEIEDDTDFDILSGGDRVILFEGRVQKRSLNSMMVNHLSTRHMILFNDVILLCSIHGKMLSASEVFTINQALHLDEISLTPYTTDESGVENEDEPEGFIISTLGPNGRPYILIAESESDKKIWIEEIESAILSYVSSKAEVTRKSLCPGWAHERIKGNLLSAAVDGNISELKYQISRCIAHGRSVDETDDYCMTPLHWAIMSGISVSVEALVQAGADIHAVNNALNSPLLLAAGSGAVDAFVFLVEKGSDIHLRNLNDRDAIFMMVMYARDTRSISVMVDLILSQGGDIDTPDSSGSSPLQECCSSSITPSIEILVSAGADINRPHAVSGLTPLQICCSLEEPHAETVRVVLDQGAYPNPRTSRGLTAMDMILKTYFARHPQARNDEMNTEPITPQGLVYLDDFAQKCLPSLMEVAKHGGKFTPDHVVGLRKSLIEAIDSATKLWEDAIEPEKFKEFVYLEKISEGHSEWASDRLEACQLCGERFKFSLRRHHCRVCGALCCDACSSKRLSRYQDKKNDVVEALRACDGCFNKLIFSCQQRQTDLNIMDKALRKASVQTKDRGDSTGSGPYKGNTSMMKNTLFGWPGGTPSPNKGADKTGSNDPAAVTSLQAQTAETMQALQERGERLEQVKEKASKMNDAASDFHESTQKLLQQQRAKQWF